MSIASMNKGDCFILDNGNNIYVYVGEKSKSVEKLRAVSAANLFRDTDHRGRSKVSVIGKTFYLLYKNCYCTLHVHKV